MNTKKPRIPLRFSSIRVNKTAKLPMMTRAAYIRPANRTDEAVNGEL